MTTAPALLSVQQLRKSFRTKRGALSAIDGVSFSMLSGESIAVVGESGCGKSTLAMLLLGLISADSGTVDVDGRPMGPDCRAIGRTRPFGAVFQNPQSSLNPRMTVRAIVGEPLATAFGSQGKTLSEQVAALLAQVGLGASYLERYPHELSGGQMQRVAIARALAPQPKLLILDEPTAALDVSVGAQILRLLRDLQARCSISYLLITHDLGAVNDLAERVLVMYLGRIVESGPVAEVFARPQHPYTQILLEAVPTTDPCKRGHFVTPERLVPVGPQRPNGCAFAPRCPRKSSRCLRSDPQLTADERGRAHACHHPL